MNRCIDMAGLRANSATTIISWLIIVIMTVLIVMLQYQAQHQEDHINIDDVSRVNLQLRLAGRYMLGVHQLTGLMPTSQSGAYGNKMIDELEVYADRPVDQLRMVPVIAELAGKDTALQRLAELRQIPGVDSDLRRDIQDMELIYTQDIESISTNACKRLKERHHWFAKLALTYDLDPNHPARLAALAPATRTVMAIVVVMVIIAVSSLAGLVLLIVGIVFLSNGKIQCAYTAPGTSSSYWLETVAIFLVAFVALSVGTAFIEKDLGTDLAALLVWVLPLVLFWPRLRGASWQQWREGLGIDRGRGVLREMLLGVAGQLAGLPILFLSLIMVLILSFVFATPAPHPVFNQMLGSGGPWSVVKLYLLACVWAPLCEEMVFRGAFYHHIRHRWHAVIAGLVSGLIFAAIHPQGLIALPALMSLAFVFAMLREWRGSIIASMTAHACNNAFVFTLFLLLLR